MSKSIQLHCVVCNDTRAVSETAALELGSYSFPYEVLACGHATPIRPSVKDSWGAFKEMFKSLRPVDLAPNHVWLGDES